MRRVLDVLDNAVDCLLWVGIVTLLPAAVIYAFRGETDGVIRCFSLVSISAVALFMKGSKS